MEGSCEHSNEPSGSIKSCGNSRVVEQLATFQEGHVSMELVSYLARRLNLRGVHTFVPLGYVACV
jgi:hypothetical protein